MSAELFEAALGIAPPWSVQAVEFDESAKRLTVLIDFKPGTHFAVSGHAGEHPVHDTVVKTYRHLNFFQHECHLQVRTPRVRLPHGAVRQIEPDFAGRLSGFTLLFEALVLMLAQQMPFAAVARIVGESARLPTVCQALSSAGGSGGMGHNGSAARIGWRPRSGRRIRNLNPDQDFTCLAARYFAGYNSEAFSRHRCLGTVG